MIKRWASLALCMALLCTLLPQIGLLAAADGYTELGVISEVRATAVITAPTMGGTRTIPQITVTDPTNKGVRIPSMTVWQKKVGNSWENYNEKTFTAGTYRLDLQLRSESFSDKTYYRLASNTVLYVNGTAWEQSMKLVDQYQTAGYGFMRFCGQEYDVRPEGEYMISVYSDGNGTVSASHASAAPGTVVTLTATPSSQYYKLKNWEVRSGGVTVNGNQFTMGNEDVLLKAHFEEVSDYNLGTITEVRAEAEISVPSLGGSRVVPQFTVADPVDKKISIPSMTMWQKKNGNSWENYYGATFLPGIYRLDLQLRSDCFPDGTFFRLTDNTVLYVNGKAWKKSMKLIDQYATAGFGFMRFCSEEFLVTSESDCAATVTLPLVGRHPVFTGEAGNPERYTVSSVDFYAMKDDGNVGAKLAESATFERDKTYRVMVFLIRKGDWSFTDDTKVSINGQEATRYQRAEYYGVYYIDVKAGNPFVDIGEGDFFFNPVLWAVENGITAGTDDTHFSPAKTVMRSDSMVFFWAAMDRPAHSDMQSPFKDVKKKHWFYDAVMWAVENKITGGTDATHFSPNNTCSRSEILQFLYAAVGKTAYTIGNPYSDVKPKHWYYEGAIWAYEKGLEKGENGKFQAKTPCTRAYVVTYLYRFITSKELAE